MNISQAILERRSIRKFSQKPIPREALLRIAEAARLAPTAMNRQPLSFVVADSSVICGRIFPHTAWAGRIPDGGASPDEQTQPVAYIAILVDQAITINADTDCGAAAMAMMIEAQAQGIASCWLGSIRRSAIMELLKIDQARYQLHTILALGYPAMLSRAVPMKDDETAYYLESRDRLCVPKRDAKDIIRFAEED